MRAAPLAALICATGAGVLIFAKTDAALATLAFSESCAAFDVGFQHPRELDGISVVSCGGQHSCALHTDEHVSCWGADSHRQSSALTAILSAPGSARAVAVGHCHTCALRSAEADDSLACFGCDTHGQVSRAPLGRFARISVGPTWSCAMRQAAGQVVCWGELSRPTEPPASYYLSGGHGSSGGRSLLSSLQNNCTCGNASDTSETPSTSVSASASASSSASLSTSASTSSSGSVSPSGTPSLSSPPSVSSSASGSPTPSPLSPSPTIPPSATPTASLTLGASASATLSTSPSPLPLSFCARSSVPYGGPRGLFMLVELRCPPPAMLTAIVWAAYGVIDGVCANLESGGASSAGSASAALPYIYDSGTLVQTSAACSNVDFTAALQATCPAGLTGACIFVPPQPPADPCPGNTRDLKSIGVVYRCDVIAVSQSRTPSSTLSASLTLGAPPSLSMTALPTSSPTHTRTSTATSTTTASNTATRSTTATQTATSTTTATQTPSQTGTPSQTASITATPSMPMSPAAETSCCCGGFKAPGSDTCSLRVVIPTLADSAGIAATAAISTAAPAPGSGLSFKSALLRGFSVGALGASLPEGRAAPFNVVGGAGEDSFAAISLSGDLASALSSVAVTVLAGVSEGASDAAAAAAQIAPAYTVRAFLLCPRSPLSEAAMLPAPAVPPLDGAGLRPTALFARPPPGTLYISVEGPSAGLPAQLVTLAIDFIYDAALTRAPTPTPPPPPPNPFTGACDALTGAFLPAAAAVASDSGVMIGPLSLGAFIGILVGALLLLLLLLILLICCCCCRKAPPPVRGGGRAASTRNILASAKASSRALIAASAASSRNLASETTSHTTITDIVVLCELCGLSAARHKALEVDLAAALAKVAALEAELARWRKTGGLGRASVKSNLSRIASLAFGGSKRSAGSLTPQQPAADGGEEAEAAILLTLAVAGSQRNLISGSKRDLISGSRRNLLGGSQRNIISGSKRDLITGSDSSRNLLGGSQRNLEQEATPDEQAEAADDDDCVDADEDVNAASARRAGKFTGGRHPARSAASSHVRGGAGAPAVDPKKLIIKEGVRKGEVVAAKTVTLRRVEKVRGDKEISAQRASRTEDSATEHQYAFTIKQREKVEARSSSFDDAIASAAAAGTMEEPWREFFSAEHNAPYWGRGDEATWVRPPGLAQKS